MKKLNLTIKDVPYAAEEALNRLRVNIKFCGKNTKKIQEYIQNQLKEDWEYDQITLKEYIDPFTGEPVKQGK